jgi:hypothetical protein
VVELLERGARVCVDVEATRTMYAMIARGESDDCSCGYCAYFAAHRNEAYPDAFRVLLDRLGIDFRKENEPWSFDTENWCLFNGSFDFVGTVESDTHRSSEPCKPNDPPFAYGLASGAGYPWAQKRAIELGFAPIVHIWFQTWLPVEGRLFEDRPEPLPREDREPAG